jgi:hypothetical protein
MLTLLPDLIGVWKVQAQLVADIAGTYGKTATLTRQHMVYCLFKHSAAQLLRDVIAREGARYLVLPVTLQMMRSLVSKIGINLGERTVAIEIFGITAHTQLRLLHNCLQSRASST